MVPRRDNEDGIKIRMKGKVRGSGKYLGAILVATGAFVAFVTANWPLTTVAGSYDKPVAFDGVTAPPHHWQRRLLPG
jgi:hypothetical protein